MQIKIKISKSRLKYPNQDFKISKSRLKYANQD